MFGRRGSQVEHHVERARAVGVFESQKGENVIILVWFIMWLLTVS